MTSAELLQSIDNTTPMHPDVLGSAWPTLRDVALRFGFLGLGEASHSDLFPDILSEAIEAAEALG